MVKSLSQRFAEWLFAAVPLLWIRTREAEEALRECAQFCRQQAEKGQTWDIHRWDVARGLDRSGDCTDPKQAIDWLISQAAPEGENRRTILFAQNFHLHLRDAETMAALHHLFQAGKRGGLCLVNLAPRFDCQPEVSDLWTVEGHGLPSADQRMVILSDLAENDSDLAGGEEKLVNASAGLTRSQVEQLGSWCLANEGRIDSASLMRLKIAQLKESGVCQISLPEAGFESLGGSQNAKDFCLRLLAGKGKQPAKGILALGVPGTGKTAFARALAKETGRALIVANIGNLKGSLQGQTENNLRQLLQVADQLGSDGAKAILFFDEIEKGLAGVESSSRTDGGVMMNVYGELLKWLNDHTSDVFVIGTCNNVGALASESGGAFLRSGRFDGKLFWDFPTQEERASIWTIHKAGYGIQDETPADDGWTGADIEQACRLADTLQVPLSEAAKLVRPLSRQSLDPVRRWAEAEGCISASYRGLFRSAGAPALDTTSRRKVAKAN